MGETITAEFSTHDWADEPCDEVTDPAQGAQLGRASLRKTFTGEIEGTSTVFMLTGISARSRAYVAFERLAVTVRGRTGGFVLRHTADADGMELRVLPGSGTGELAGISGSAVIPVADGRHTLTLDCEFG